METFDSLHDKKPVFTIRNVAIMGGVLVALVLVSYGGHRIYKSYAIKGTESIEVTPLEATDVAKIDTEPTELGTIIIKPTGEATTTEPAVVNTVPDVGKVEYHDSTSLSDEDDIPPLEYATSDEDEDGERTLWNWLWGTK